MGDVAVEITVSNDRDRILASRGWLRAGAVRWVRLAAVVRPRVARLVLPMRVAEELRLEAAGEALVRHSGLPDEIRPMAAGVRLRLLDREGVFTAVLDPDREDAVIGMIVLGELDLIVDPATQSLHPRDPDGIFAEIE